MKKLKREANGTDLANKAKKNKTGIQKDEEPTESMKSTVSKLLVIRQSQNSIERTRAFLNKHRKRESKKLHQSQHFKQDANFKNSLTNNLSTVASDGMKLAESKSNEKVAICSINQETPSKQIHTLSDQTKKDKLNEIENEINKVFKDSHLQFSESPKLNLQLKYLGKVKAKYVRNKLIEGVQYTPFGTSNLMSLSGYGNQAKSSNNL